MMKQHGHFAVIAGVLAAAVMSISGTLASPRTEGAQTRESLPKSVLKTCDIAQPALALPPLRDLHAIKLSQLPLAALTRNPFRAAGVSAVSTPAKEASRSQLLDALQTLRLGSVLCTESKPSCTINGKALTEGDPCGNFIVEKIKSNSVALKSGSYRFELRVQQ